MTTDTIAAAAGRIAILGTGNMGEALLGGMLRAGLYPPDRVVATGTRQERIDEIRERWSVEATLDNRAAARGAGILLIAVKPQAMTGLLGEIELDVQPGSLVISIAAGIRTSTIARRLEGVPIIRAMPNTPVRVDEGATAIALGEGANDEHLAQARAIFDSVGKTVVVPERLLDAVTGLSGSGPAYIYMVIEALIDGGVKMGIPRQVATRLAEQTVLGAAKLVRETGLHPAILKDQVTTPGGTAIAAIHELEAHGLRPMLIAAVETATRRSSELARLLDDDATSERPK
ncbi:MAG: pyrroline-5-carboxylate reductase [Acidobacteriota bacterium]